LSAALTRYRVAAYVVGVLLVVACLSSICGHGLLPAWTGAPDPLTESFGPDFLWVWMVHGFFYVGYLVLAFDLFRRTRWPLRRLAELIVAGLLPGLTFVIERRIHRLAQRTPARLDESGAAAL
jgi:integral membrane protein